MGADIGVLRTVNVATVPEARLKYVPSRLDLGLSAMNSSVTAPVIGALPFAASRATGSVMPSTGQVFLSEIPGGLPIRNCCGRSPCQPDKTIVYPWFSRNPLPAP